MTACVEYTPGRRRRHIGDRAVAVTAVLAIVALAAMAHWGWL